MPFFPKALQTQFSKVILLLRDYYKIKTGDFDERKQKKAKPFMKFKIKDLHTSNNYKLNVSNTVFCSFFPSSDLSRSLSLVYSF